MKPRYKKLIGVLLFLPLLILYALSVASAYAFLNASQWHGFVQFMFFVIMGGIWVFPAKPCLLWMEREN